MSSSAISTVDGDISITGNGGAATNGHFQKGVYIDNATVTSTGTGASAGNITLDGYGSNTGISFNYGVEIGGSSLITVTDGDISITGHGGNGSGTNNHGILVQTGADITSTGTGASAGKITLNGTGGNGTSQNYGVYLTGSGTSLASVDGDISVTGIGATGASSNSNNGIYLESDADMLLTGSADLTLDATKGAGTSYGIFTNGATITLGGASATGDFTFITNDWSLANLAVQNSGTLTIKPKTEPTSINISGDVGGLQLTDTYLGYFSGFSKLIIGDSVDGGGAVDIDSWDLSAANFSNMGTLEVYGGSIDLDGLTNATNKNMIFSASGLNASTGVVDIDALSLTNNDGMDRTFYSRSASSTVLTNSTLTASNGALNFFINADSNGDSDGAIYMDVSNVTLNGGEAILSGGNSGQTWLSAADLAYLRSTGTAYGNATYVNGIYMDSSSILATAMSGSSAGITLRGAGKDGGSGGGINIRDGGGVRSLGTAADAANITLTGVGGNGTNSNYGVWITGGVSYVKTEKGAISITGTGRGTGNTNYGVRISSNSAISSTDGSIDITGVSTGAGANNYGVTVESSADILSLGTGATAAPITIHGTGGNGTSDNYGIRLDGSPTILSSVDGAIDLTGIGGNGSGANNYGIYMGAGINLRSTGTTADAATITLEGTGVNGTTDNRGVYLTGAGTTITSVLGAIDITGTGGTGTSTSNTGVYLDFSALITAVNGSIDITGTGRSTGAGGSNHGVFMLGGSDVTSTGTVVGTAATINITGTGGNGTSNNWGTYISGSGTTVTSALGTIDITGTGGNGNGAQNYGYFMTTSAVVTSGKGDITITGTGGDGVGAFNYGVSLQNASVISSTVSGADAADITIVGTGGDGSLNNHGVYLKGVGTSLASVDGDVSITGVGASGATNNTNHGVYFTSDSDLLITGAGSLLIDATKGAGTSNAFTTSGATITIGGGTATGDFVFAADDMSLADLSVQTTGGVGLKAKTAGTAINIGSGAATMGLSLTDTELGFFNASTLTIGDTATSGDVHVNTAHSFSEKLTVLAGLTHDVYLDAVLVSTASGDAIVLVAGDDFINSADATALDTDNGRWLVYSGAPTENIRDGLLPTASEFGKTYALNAPATIGAGNRFVYATSTRPTLTLDVNDDNVTYGDSYSGGSYSYASGLVGDDTLGTIGLTGAASFSTPYTAGSSVAGGPYALNGASGTLASVLGYDFTFNAGALTVDKRALTATIANPAAQTYGDFAPTLTKTSDVTWGNLYSGDTGADIDSVTFTYGGATAGAINNAGSYVLGIGAFSDDNYTLNLGADVTNGTLTVTPAAGGGGTPTPEPPVAPEPPVTPEPPATPNPEPPAPVEPVPPPTGSVMPKTLPNTVVRTAQNPLAAMGIPTGGAMTGNGAFAADENTASETSQAADATLSTDEFSFGHEEEEDTIHKKYRAKFKKLLGGLIEIHPKLVRLFSLDNNQQNL